MTIDLNPLPVGADIILNPCIIVEIVKVKKTVKGNYFHDLRVIADETKLTVRLFPPDEKWGAKLHIPAKIVGTIKEFNGYKYIETSPSRVTYGKGQVSHEELDAVDSTTGTYYNLTEEEPVPTVGVKFSDYEPTPRVKELLMELIKELMK